MSTTENNERVATIVREKLGACGAIIKGGTHVCILPAGHEPSEDCPHPAARCVIGKSELLLALGNRRSALDHDQMHPERIKEVTDIIDMIEAWETPP